MSIVLTPFARPRLFPRTPRGNTIQDITPAQFEAHLNSETPHAVLDGYAPFCKLFVYENWTSTRCLTVPITDANRGCRALVASTGPSVDGSEDPTEFDGRVENSTGVVGGRTPPAQ